MIIELILVAVSVVVLVSLLFVRHYNLAYAKSSANEFLDKSDYRIYSEWNWFAKFYQATSRDIVELVKDSPHIVLHFLSKVFYFLYKKTRKLVDLIKGNKIKTDRGSVSIYLKKIEK